MVSLQIGFVTVIILGFIAYLGWWLERRLDQIVDLLSKDGEVVDSTEHADDSAEEPK